MKNDKNGRNENIKVQNFPVIQPSPRKIAMQAGAAVVDKCMWGSLLPPPQSEFHPWAPRSERPPRTGVHPNAKVQPLSMKTRNICTKHDACDVVSWRQTDDRAFFTLLLVFGGARCFHCRLPHQRAGSPGRASQQVGS